MHIEVLATRPIVTSMVAGTHFWQGEPPPYRLHSMISVEGGRWSAPGVPTVYLAGDAGLALIEGGRHLPRVDELAPRALWAAWVETGGLVDLTRAEARSALDLPEGYWFLDRGRCLDLAEQLREMGDVTGLIVPSAGVPDDQSRTNVVLYMDRLTEPLEAVVLEPRVVGTVLRS